MTTARGSHGLTDTQRLRRCRYIPNGGENGVDGSEYREALTTKMEDVIAAVDGSEYREALTTKNGGCDSGGARQRIPRSAHD